MRDFKVVPCPFQHHLFSKFFCFLFPIPSTYPKLLQNTFFLQHYQIAGSFSNYLNLGILNHLYLYCKTLRVVVIGTRVFLYFLAYTLFFLSFFSFLFKKTMAEVHSLCCYLFISNLWLYQYKIYKAKTLQLLKCLIVLASSVYRVS